METISLSDFHHLIVHYNFNNPTSLLILDSRPYISYNDGHIVGAKNMYCPPISKRRFVNGGKLHLEKMLDSEVRHRLVSGGYSQIVIYGESEDELNHSDSNVNIVWHSIKQLGFGGICKLLKGIYMFYNHNNHLSKNLTMLEITTVQLYLVFFFF